jgi:hypothetical protein
MRCVVAITLLFAAVIHAMPLAGVLGPARLQSLYALPVDDPNLEILLRHRAVLFGLLAAFLACAAFRPALRPLALMAGLVSVVSFLALAFSVGDYNQALSAVVRADMVALAALVVGLAVHVITRRGTVTR